MKDRLAFDLNTQNENEVQNFLRCLIAHIFFRK